MKIFNWVHRKFHHNAIKDDGLDKKEAESQTFLRQISLEVGLLDDAILTIGTFGLDHSNLPSFHHHYPIPYDQPTEAEAEEDYSSSNGDESEVNPLVVKHQDEFEFDVMMSPEKSASAPAAQPIMSVDGVSLTADDPEKTTGPRTTLADLFRADSNPNLKHSDSSTKRHATATGHTKNGFFSPKKLIPHVGHKSHPVKTLNRMMKKMMKRKIHPELVHGNWKNVEMEHEAIGETAYLLPIPA